MQMEADEDEASGEPRMRWTLASTDGRTKGKATQGAGDHGRREGADEREHERMQRMMILRKPQARMGRMPGEEFGNYAQASQVARDSRDYDHGLLSPGERSWPDRVGRGCNRPSGKQVRK